MVYYLTQDTTHLIQDTTLAGIADAIRGKTGGTDPIPVPDMEEMPTHIMIAADFPSVVARSFVAYYGGFAVEDSAGDGTIDMRGYIKYCAASFIEYMTTNQDSAFTNRTGVWNLTNKGFTFRSNYYGGAFTHFRAGYTYTIVALRMVTL